MLNKLLALAFVGLLATKMLFRPQWRKLARWFDALVNDFLFAIVLAYSIQVVMWLSR
jgi:hypothetical protein